MCPTLLPGSQVLVLRHWPDKWLHKGQIVVGDLRKVLANIPSNHNVRFPFSDLEVCEVPSEKFIKRLTGMPGDTIRIARSELHEKIRTIIQSDNVSDEYLVWRIPTGYCFVQGDGDISGDSVIWGPIPLKFLTGIVLTELPHNER